MEIDDFMDITKPIKRVNVSASTTAYTYVPVDDTASMRSAYNRERAERGTEYSAELKRKLDEEMLENSIMCSTKKGESSKHGYDSDEDMDDRDIYRPSTSNSHRSGAHGFATAEKLNLVIYKHMDTILRKIRGSPVCIIKGETGCGKSTQVPQYILGDANRRGEACNILVTQPRRIAARSLASRVANERKCELGAEVGYQVGLEKSINESTKILYCTTGVALRKLVKSKSMNHYSHIILDEVHERDEEMEFLLIVVKYFLSQQPYGTKLILMSATFDISEFEHYLRVAVRGRFVQPKIINLSHSRGFKIEKYYLDDIQLIAKQAVVDYETPGIDLSLYNIMPQLISYFDKFDSTSLFGETTKYTVLVFLPGINEIKTLCNILKTSPKSPKIQVVMLHSSISAEEQRKVFIKSEAGFRKVILATNIAESSITLPDIRYVVDFCLTKVLEADNRTQFTTLKLGWASKNSCEQRAGRAGRTMDGFVYRLVKKEFFEHYMTLSDKPALLRCSLEKIVLKSKMLDLDMPPHNIIGLAVNPPDKHDIQNAVLTLKELRGLHLNVDNQFVEDDGELTFLGHIMEELPIDVRCSRLIALGYLFSVLDECIIIAAGLTVQKVFIFDPKEPMRTYFQKLHFADGSGSDLIAILNAYNYWNANVKQNRFPSNDQARACERHCLDIHGLYEMYSQIQEIEERLKHFKLFDNGLPKIPMSQRDKNIAIKVCIAGAFYPNFFLRKSVTSIEDHERTIFHELNGRDPCNTIYYRGIDTKEHPLLYQNQIKEFLRKNNVISSNDDVKISVDEGSSKVFVTFLGKQENIDAGPDRNKAHSDWVPGRVRTQVYKALKLTRERIQLKLRVCNDESLMQFCRDAGCDVNDPCGLKRDVSKFADLCVLPDSSVKSIIGVVTFIQHPNKFWFRPDIKHNDRIYDAIRSKLHSRQLPKVPVKANLKGKIVAVKHLTEHQTKPGAEKSLHRAKVLSSVFSSMYSKSQYQLLLIDEGEEIVADSEMIYNIDELTINPRDIGIKWDGEAWRLTEIPPRAFEATLAEVQPSYIKSSVGKWTPDAVCYFKETCFNDSELKADVYSVWNGVVSLTLYMGDMCVNKRIVQQDMAQRCEENYPSKRDHAIRYKNQFYMENDAPRYCEYEAYLRDFAEKPIQCPSTNYLKRTITLRGPVSPLETTIHAATLAGATNKITICRQSVNSILLDTDPQEPNERLIIATSVSTNAQNEELTLRNTTVMPNIHGFAPIMAMLFSPAIELHRDDSKTRYSNVLCGLGYESVELGGRSQSVSVFEDHDLSIGMDVVMNDSDMERINKIRSNMSTLLFTAIGQPVPQFQNKDDIIKVQKEIKTGLFNLLQIKRNLIDIRPTTNEFDWGNIYVQEMLEIPSVFGDRAIFPHFKFMKLYPEDPDNVTLMRNHNQHLNAVAFCSEPLRGEIECLLCSKVLTSISELQIHLFTKLHQDRVEQTHASFQIERYKRQKPVKKYNYSDYF